MLSEFTHKCWDRVNSENQNPFILDLEENKLMYTLYVISYCNFAKHILNLQINFLLMFDMVDPVNKYLRTCLALATLLHGGILQDGVVCICWCLYFYIQIISFWNTDRDFNYSHNSSSSGKGLTPLHAIWIVLYQVSFILERSAFIKCALPLFELCLHSKQRLTNQWW